MIKDILVFALTSNVSLTDKVCSLLGIQRSEAEILHFADGECWQLVKLMCVEKKYT